MTENEAMKNLETLERFYRIAKSGSALHEVLINFVTLEDLVVAIQALEEIQKYRAIGTVEDIRNTHLLCEVFSSTVRDYTTIGTVDEFKALKEKSVAKKMDRYYCPICRHYFEDGEAHNYCPECGQALET